MNKYFCEICVIGGGSGGLSLASGAAQLGINVILIERAAMGGDCLNHGCVPSKSFIAAARIANSRHEGKVFGVTPTTADVNIARVQKHVADVIASIAPHDSVERFESLGVKVLKGDARFADKKSLTIHDKKGRTIATVNFDEAVIATGSRASVPPIPGLVESKPLTNETIFDLKVLPKTMLVIGGGPIGCELAQSWQRLGSQVTLLEALPRILSRDDQDAAALVKKQLIQDGLKIMEQVKIANVEAKNGKTYVAIEHQGKIHRLSGDALLVAAGRRPNIEGLNLEAAGVTYTRAGIDTDTRLKTHNKRVYAIGDVNNRSLAFTHVAGYQASLMVRNLLFKMRSSYKNDAIPWCTYTDPELAHVGMSEEQAKQKLGTKCHVLNFDWHNTDRGRAERVGQSLIKVIADSKGYVHGATLVGPHAGEHIAIWTMMISQKIKLSSLAGMVFPYPTLSEGHKQVAGLFYRDRLFANKTRRLIRILRHLPI